MDSKCKKVLAVLVLLLVVGLVAATGFLKSQSGPIVLIPENGQVLPNVTDTG